MASTQGLLDGKRFSLNVRKLLDHIVRHAATPPLVFSTLEVVSHVLDWIDLFQARITQKTQAGHTKYCMEDINHVTGSV